PRALRRVGLTGISVIEEVLNRYQLRQSGRAPDMITIVVSDQKVGSAFARLCWALRGSSEEHRLAVGRATGFANPDPAGWVWLNQRPLVIGPLADETRWP